MEEKEIIINGHEAVDLGLSVKWATCNIGATKPEECGDYFAWGETSPKDVYTEEAYLYYDAANNRKLIDIGTEISGTEYDAARKQWGMIGECLLKKNCMNCLETVYGNGLP